MQKDEIYKRDQAVEKDQYEKINRLTARVEQLTGSVDVSNQLVIRQMEQSAADHKAAMQELRTMHDSYAKMTRWIVCSLITIILFLTGAIVYGAIGREGFYSVRPNFPQTAQFQTDMIPFNDRQLIFGMKRGASAA